MSVTRVSRKGRVPSKSNRTVSKGEEDATFWSVPVTQTTIKHVNQIASSQKITPLEVLRDIVEKGARRMTVRSS